MVAYHLPGYRYCGPGTEDFTATPINELDRACRVHDLAYMNSRSREKRMAADLVLYHRARALQTKYPEASIVKAAMLLQPGRWYRG